jgi:hypothetical protein
MTTMVLAFATWVGAVVPAILLGGCTNRLIAVSQPGDDTDRDDGDGRDDGGDEGREGEGEGDDGGPAPHRCEVEPLAVSILPRTSNEEFRLFVSDLLGRPLPVERFAQWTPLAQVNGFDTMTESRIDPGALEAQLATVEGLSAELMATPAIMEGCPTPSDPPPLCPVHAGYDATAQFSGEQGRDCWSYLGTSGAPLSFSAADGRWFDPADPGLFLWHNGMHPGIGVDVTLRWTAPADGDATLSGSFFDADPGGGDGVVVVVRGPGGDLFRAVIVNGGAREQFEAALPVRRGDVVDVVVQRQGNNSWDTTGHAVAVAFSAATPSAGRTWDNCGQHVVERVAARAFRRPLRSEERDELRRVFEETATAATQAGLSSVFPEALGAALQATLLSPHVLYKPELVPGGFDVEEEQYRRASRLALFFRGSFPDDELRDLADVGALADDDALAAQAGRLLAVDGDRFAEHFAGQWLDFRVVGSTSPVSTDPLAVSMRHEAHAVFAAVLADGLPAERLLSPGFTFVDERLAAHYGLTPDPSAPVDAAGFVRTSTDARGGLFAQGHFLTSTATGSDFKRVIRRGLFALGRTMCRSMPMLDPATREEINASVGQIDPTTPLGAQMQIHRATSERCLACHSQMDPPGLALERYDARGLERSAYADGSAVDNDFDFNGVRMRNPAELSAFLQGSGDYRRCVVEKLLTWGLHRAVRPEEQCVVEEIAGFGGSSGPDAESPPLRDLSVEAFLTSLRLTEVP